MCLGQMSVRASLNRAIQGQPMSLNSQMAALRHKLEREPPDGALGKLQAEAAKRHSPRRYLCKAA
jgi:hypothetical protein